MALADIGLYQQTSVQSLVSTSSSKPLKKDHMSLIQKILGLGYSKNFLSTQQILDLPTAIAQDPKPTQ